MGFVSVLGSAVSNRNFQNIVIECRYFFPTVHGSLAETYQGA